MAAQIHTRGSPYHSYQAPPAYLSAAGISLYHQSREQQHLHSTLELRRGIVASSRHHSNAYMNPNLPHPAPQQTSQTSPHHGIKRSAPDIDDDFERSSHISTQLKKLRLNSDQDPHSDVIGHAQPDAHPKPFQSPVYERNALNSSHNAPTAADHRAEPLPTLPSSDFMTVDDTPHKVFIPDLESEIASIEAAEKSSSQLFLPDFEKQIGAIPDHVLRSNAAGQSVAARENSRVNDQALVLYRDPSSISVPESEDAVRKAISDTRRGIRERMRREQQRERETAHLNLAREGWIPGRHGFGSQHPGFSDQVVADGHAMDDNDNYKDEDAMEIE